MLLDFFFATFPQEHTRTSENWYLKPNTFPISTQICLSEGVAKCLKMAILSIFGSFFDDFLKKISIELYFFFTILWYPNGTKTFGKVRLFKWFSNTVIDEA